MIFNKTNFRIHSLAEKASGDYSTGIRVTPDFTEVTNGHYLVRVDAPFKGKRKEALRDLPICGDFKPVEKECRFVISADSAKEIERNTPNKEHIPVLGLLDRLDRFVQPPAPTFARRLQARQSAVEVRGVVE